jgi:hypothetical protein
MNWVAEIWFLVPSECLPLTMSMLDRLIHAVTCLMYILRVSGVNFGQD